MSWEYSWESSQEYSNVGNFLGMLKKNEKIGRKNEKMKIKKENFKIFELLMLKLKLCEQMFFSFLTKRLQSLVENTGKCTIVNNSQVGNTVVKYPGQPENISGNFQVGNKWK